jgi:hypothetical protein
MDVDVRELESTVNDAKVLRRTYNQGVRTILGEPTARVKHSRPIRLEYYKHSY